jgi:hypothetical protein
MDRERFGTELKEFFRGLLSNDLNMDSYSKNSLTPTNISSPNGYGDEIYNNYYLYNDYYKNNRNTTESGIGLACNQAAHLKSGNLLVVFQDRCYEVDINTKEITYVFELKKDPRSYWWMAVPATDGCTYCSISGTTTQTTPEQFARFGNAGAVVKVDHINKKLDIIAEGGNVVDPFGLQFIDDHQLIVCDFNSWGGSGYVAIIDVRTGASKIVAEGGEFVDPQMATIDKEGILWVANAMHQQYDGQIIKVNKDKTQSIVYPSHGPGSGIVSGIFNSNVEEKVLFVIIDWPFMSKSAVMSLDKATGQTEVLLGASKERPKLYNAHGAVSGNILWIGESYDNEIIGFDLNTNQIIDRIDISGLLGVSKGFKVRGIIDSFDFLECVNIIP